MARKKEVEVENENSKAPTAVRPTCPTCGTKLARIRGSMTPAKFEAKKQAALKALLAVGLPFESASAQINALKFDEPAPNGL